jgi:predicted MFS family arabinose efflux permease
VLSAAFITPLAGGAALFTWGIVGWVAWPAQQHRLNSLSPQDAGVVLALNNSSYILGAAAGAGIGGLLLNSFSLDSLGWFASVASLFALLTLLLSMIVQQRQARAVYADHQLLTLERKS